MVVSYICISFTLYVQCTGCYRGLQNLCNKSSEVGTSYSAQSVPYMESNALCCCKDSANLCTVTTPVIVQVLMAHKVLSADMSHLVGAMKNAQKQYQTFLEQEYQKQMLHAAHIVAVNAKQLLDAANSARRKAYSLQR